MSWQASAWAKKQMCGSLSGKAVLLLLAEYANPENGSCWPRQTVLAEQSEQSLASVQRRLVDLERKRLIFRVARRKRSGHYTSDEIIVLIDETARRYALSKGWDPDAKVAAPAKEAPGDTPEDCDISTAPQSAVWHQSDVASPHQCNPATRHSCNTEETTRTYSPLNPPEIGDSTPVPPKRTDPVPPDWREDWSKLDALWPWPPDALKEPSRRAFQRLDPHERASALKHAPDFIASRQRNGPKRFFDARRYLSDHGWEPWASGTAQKANSLGVFVLKGTPAWDAWARVKRAENGTSLLSFWVTIEGKRVEGIYRPTLFPRPHVQAGEDSHVANQSPSTGSARMPWPF